MGIRFVASLGGRVWAVLAALAAAAVLSFVFIGSAGALSVRPRLAPRLSGSAACASPDLGTARDPANPLALPTAPTGGDPLRGAHFFVDGPLHGQAAGAIAQLLGISPASFSATESWAAFALANGPAIQANPQAAELAQIAGQEATQDISLYAEGGGQAGVYGQTLKILCNNMQADPTPGTVPVLSTFFIYPNGQFCPKTLEQIQSWQPTFKADVNGMAQAIGTKRAVILQEIDSLGTSGCLMGNTKVLPSGRIVWSTLDPRMKLWLWDLAYESSVFAALPHTVVYQEAGYSDNRSGPNGAQTTADLLDQAGIQLIRGFWTNGTHFAWSQSEIAWANLIVHDLAADSGGKVQARYIVNTAQNGQGPLVPANVVKQGNEALCNPPGRGLGRTPTADTDPTVDGENFPTLDAFLWTGVPGRSHASNCPGGPWAPAGVFDPRFAEELASDASQQLGPAAGPTAGNNIPPALIAAVKSALNEIASELSQLDLAKALAQGSITLTLNLNEAGTLAINLDAGHNVHIAKVLRNGTVLAGGKVVARHAGKVKLKLRLTAAGKKALRGLTRALPLQITANFVSSTGIRYATSRAARIRPRHHAGTIRGAILLAHLRRIGV